MSNISNKFLRQLFKIFACGYTFVASASGGYIMIESLIPANFKNSIFTIFAYIVALILAFYITLAVDKLVSNQKN